jgi:transposase InsO family protein
VSEWYEFIDAQKAYYPIVLMCIWAGVSRSGFYDWLARPASATAERRRELEALVAWVFDRSDQTYGYRRVHAELARRGVPAGPELVRAVMRGLGLVPCQPRPFRPTTTIPGDAEGVPDLVARDFSADAPGTKLVGDITYIPLARPDGGHEWAYLATVIDCYSKACIGWALAGHMRTDLVCDALDMAARNYPLAPKCIFHSDRGTQYMSDQFTKHTGKLDIRHSVGRTGICYDNALAESFNATIKIERVYRTTYSTLGDARRDIARYIELRYNTRRLHSALDYRTPREAYEGYINNQEKPAAA